MALVEMRHISKSFGPVQALKDVSLYVNPGEVLGLVGDNAAGKSTLMKILTGAYRADSGMILVNHQPAEIAKPQDSRRLGIEMVYQDLALANNLDVVANLYLGQEIVKRKIGPFRLLDNRAMRAGADNLIGRLRIDIPDPAQPVEHLSGGQRQAVAIGRATLFDARLVIMDEPTAALSLLAINQVLRLIGQLSRKGIAVILISHRLDDVIAASNRVVVLRQGQVVALRVVDKMHPDSFRQTLLADMEGIARADKDTPTRELRPYSGASCGVTPF
jgi:simple sugar transport system ATP-binding protein